jgi:hypothetical protein
MTYNWEPVGDDHPARPGNDPAHDHALEEYAELFARTIAHLAAQLTMTQLRLRAFATAAVEQGAVDPDRVASHLAILAERETGRYLRENLGEALTEAIDVESLERDISAYLRGEASRG